MEHRNVKPERFRVHCFNLEDEVEVPIRISGGFVGYDEAAGLADKWRSEARETGFVTHIQVRKGIYFKVDYDP